MYIPWIKYGSPCTDSKKIITDNKVRSPKQRVVDRIMFMLKIFFRASRETDYPGQDEYFNGSGMLHRSLLKGGKCASTTNDLNKEKKKPYKMYCSLSTWFTTWRSDRFSIHSMAGRTQSIYLISAHFTKSRRSCSCTRTQTHAPHKAKTKTREPVSQIFITMKWEQCLSFG